MPQTLLTDVAEQKLATAATSSSKVAITHIALGDGGGKTYDPAHNQRALKHERARRAIDSRAQTGPNAWLVKTAFPADTPAFPVREIGFFDSDGTLIAIWAGADVAPRQTGAIVYQVEHALTFSAVKDGLIIVDGKDDRPAANLVRIKALESGKLDKTGKAADANMLDGHVSSYFAPVKDLAGKVDKSSPVGQVVFSGSRLTVGPGGDFKDLQAAWNSLLGKVLTHPVVIKVADGTHTVETLTFANQPFAHQIRIEGNLTNPAACVIKLNGGLSPNNRIWFGNVRGLTFSGFKIVGGKTDTNWTRAAMILSQKAMVVCNDKSLIIEGCVGGIALYEQSYLYAPGVRIAGCAGWHITVNQSSMAVFHGAYVDGLDLTAETKTPAEIDPNRTPMRPFGILSSEGSRIYVFRGVVQNVVQGFLSHVSSCFWCDACTAKHCDYGMIAQHNSTLWTHLHPAVSGDDSGVTTAIIDHCYFGISSVYGSYVKCLGAQISNCTRQGISAEWNSLVEASGAKVSNCPTGLRANINSSISANGVTTTGCTTPYSPPLNTTSSTCGQIRR